jgi:glycosyltransferase involved in cell wall biosynthesis
MIPKISVIIPVYNEEYNLKRLLKSLEKQSYPKNSIEYIVVNDASNDESRNLAKSFGSKIIDVNTHDIELNKGIGMHAATGDFVYWLDADMEIFSENYFELMSKPLIDDPTIIGSFTKEFALDCKPNIKNSLLRFISYDPLQRDPLYQFFSPSIESLVIDKKKDYFICEFKPGNIPPCGRMMYRRTELLETEAGKDKSFIDLETLEIVSRAGYSKFAYVPTARIRHYHAENLNQLISKRLRNLERDYLPNIGKKYYVWFSLENKKDLLKIIYWVFSANLLIPQLLIGIYKTIRNKDYAFMWQPLVALLTTDAIIYGFLMKQKGRKLISTLFINLFKL